MTAETHTDLLQVIYISLETHPFTFKELTELLKNARQHNQSKGITGMLVYHDHAFLQFLEGNENAVSQLFKKIEKDHRHKSVKILFNDIIPQKEFETWPMGFVNPSRYPLDLEGFVDFLELKQTHFDATRAKKSLAYVSRGALAPTRTVSMGSIQTASRLLFFLIVIENQRKSA